MQTPANDPAPAALAYEIHNALAVISGHAQLLQRQARRGKPLEPPVVLGRATIIDDHCRRLATLVALLREESSLSLRPPPDDTSAA